MIACVPSDQLSRMPKMSNYFLLYQFSLRIKNSCFRFSIFNLKLKLENQFLIINFQIQKKKKKIENRELLKI